MTSRIGVHSCILIFVASIMVVLVDPTFTIWIGYQIFILQGTLVVLLIDQLFWVGSSMLLYFQALNGHLHYLTAMKAIEKKDPNKWNTQIDELKDKVEQFSISKYTPNFMIRFFTVILVAIYTYSIIYYSVELSKPGSFIDTTGGTLGYFQFMYYSIVITTSLNTSIDPQTIIARTFSALQGFTNLYLFVLVISFFASVSESQIETERKSLLRLICAVTPEQGCHLESK